MNKVPFCIECAFRFNVENNSEVMVMSINSKKLETRCYKCDARIGHSKVLNRLIGVYHEARHEESGMIRKTDSLKTRFNIFRANKYNGDTLNCFVMAVRHQKYTERTIREALNELVLIEDVEMYDKKKLLAELVEVSREDGGQNTKK